MPILIPSTLAPSTSALMDTAIQRLLQGEALEPFCDWFATHMSARVNAQIPPPPGREDEARRYQRHVARLLWGALPVPFNRWRARGLPKVERNGPCHCGSGLKFKQCCAQFAGVAAPFEPDSLYTLALAQAEPAMLTPAQLRLVPGEALGMTAMDWNDQNRYEHTAAILAPLFERASLMRPGPCFSRPSGWRRARRSCCIWS